VLQTLSGIGGAGQGNANPYGMLQNQMTGMTNAVNGMTGIPQQQQF